MAMRFCEVEHQAAGHDGMLSSEDGEFFIKPVCAKEQRFYEELAKLESGDGQEDVSLRDFTCCYYGTLRLGISEQARQGEVPAEFLEVEQKQAGIPESQKEAQAGAAEPQAGAAEPQAGAQAKRDETKEYLVLENVLRGFSKPAVMDIKLGSVLYDDDASEHKKQRLNAVRDSTTSASLKYRVCGMRLCVNSQGEYSVFDKWYGRALQPTDMQAHFSKWFRSNALKKEYVEELIESTIVNLQMLYNCLLDGKVKLRGCSLLFVYEADNARWDQLAQADGAQAVEKELQDDDEDDANNSMLSCVKLIDFAHSEIGSFPPDEDVLSGVERLISDIQLVL